MEWSRRGENEPPNMQEVTVGGQTILEAKPERKQQVENSSS